MKKVITVNSDEVCKMKNKTNYKILDEKLIHKYIRKYISTILSKEDNVIKRINEDYKKNKFYVELLYDSSTLIEFEIIFDDDFLDFDLIKFNKNKFIFFNYKECDLKLGFNLQFPSSYYTSKCNYKNYVCIHQLYGCDYSCHYFNECTKYNNLLKK